MKKIILILFILLGFTVSATQAYWANDILTNSATREIVVKIGDWTFSNTIEGWDLNKWITEEKKGIIPKGQPFVYNGVVYISNADNYSPLGTQYWEGHGLPSSSNNWAWRANALEYNSEAVYDTGSVVAIKGRYFLAVNGGNNGKNPLYFHGVLTSGKPWIEIEPLPESFFDNIEGYPNIKIYRADISEVIFVN